MSATMPTRRNGGIPPSVRRIELIEVGALIGEGVEGDPLRLNFSYHAPDGTHLFSKDEPIDGAQS